MARTAFDGNSSPEPARESCRRAQKGVIGRDNLSFRVKDYDPVINAIDHGFEPFSLGTDLAHQSSYRVGHGIELTAQPSQGIGAFYGDAALEVALGNQACGFFQTLQSAQNRHPDHHKNGSHEDEGQCTCTCYHPTQIPCHSGADLAGTVIQNQNPIDFLSGSWHLWHSSWLRIGTTVRRMVPPLVSITRLDARRSGGSRWHAWQVGEPMRKSSPARAATRVAFHTVAVQQHELLTRACLPNLSIICAIKERSFPSIWCSSAVRMSSPSASAFVRAASSRLLK